MGVITSVTALTIAICMLLLLSPTAHAAASIANPTAHAGPQVSLLPMICHTHATATFTLPARPQCTAPADASANPRRMRVQIFKQNHLLYQVTAHLCQKFITKRAVYVYFWNSDHRETQAVEEVAVSADECRLMIAHGRCFEGALTVRGGRSETSNVVSDEMPPAYFKCCEWRQYTATNCVLTQSSVHHRPGAAHFETAAGSVRHCQFENGQCTLKTGATLIWEKAPPEHNCQFLEWRKSDGYAYSDHFVSVDGGDAININASLPVVDCGRDLLIPPTGVAFKILEHTRSRRRARDEPLGEGMLNSKGTRASPSTFLTMQHAAVTHLRLNTIEERLKSGIVMSDELASNLEAMRVRLRHTMRIAIRQAVMATCNNYARVVELTIANVQNDPTTAMRVMIGRQNLVARVSAGLVRIFPCALLAPDDFEFLPMPGPLCTKYIPILFKSVRGRREQRGYMCPATNVIYSDSLPEMCEVIDQTPLRIGMGIMVYDRHNASLTPMPDQPVLDAFQTDADTVISGHYLPSDTDVHNNAMYGWETLTDHVGVGEMLEAVQQELAIQHDIGAPKHDAATGRAQWYAARAFFPFLPHSWFEYARAALLLLIAVGALRVLYQLCAPRSIRTRLDISLTDIGANIRDRVKKWQDERTARRPVVPERPVHYQGREEWTDLGLATDSAPSTPAHRLAQAAPRKTMPSTGA